jgi:hypothetical protein
MYDSRYMLAVVNGEIPLGTTAFRDRRYAVSPQSKIEGFEDDASCGTCGWHPLPWTVVFTTASSREQAKRQVCNKFRRLLQSMEVSV